MQAKILKKWIAPLANTPLHPQWLLGRSKDLRPWLQLTGRTLDIGCGDRSLCQNLPDPSQYIGLDYLPTATEWYGSKPDVFGDGQALPFDAASFDSVTLIHVLEHLPDPGLALRETWRTLKLDGVLLLEVPCVYPLHDAPLDFQRWTIYGLRKIVESNGFEVIEAHSEGSPPETAAVLYNLAISELLLSGFSGRPLVWLVAPLLLLLIPVINLVGWLLGSLAGNSGYMPSRNWLLARKPRK
ncbi:MAG: class I SAM-dependent methyltransferase [Sedimenticola sp.]